MRYSRLGTLSIEEGMAILRAHQARPENEIKQRVEIMGQMVALGGMRIQSFFHKELCCSSEECSLKPAFFAIEKGEAKRKGRVNRSNYQLNIYGINECGDEIEFTHDHTLARGLGGEDVLENISIMCLRCNQRKSYFEHQEMIRRGMVWHGPTFRGEIPPLVMDLKPEHEHLRENINFLSHIFGMSSDQYREHCNLAGTTLGPPLKAWPIEEREEALALGLTRPGYRFYQRSLKYWKLNIEQWEHPIKNNPQVIRKTMVTV